VRHLVSLAPVLAVAVLAACGSDDPGRSAASGRPATGASSSAAGGTSPPTTPADAPSSPTLTRGPLPADLRERPAVAKALADAAQRQHVSEPQVQVAAWSEVTWNDGSLGCPRPGQAYTQALVDGQLLLLRVDRTLLAYHAGPDGTFAYCADPQGTYTIRTP
jgi:hypothetical protein